MRLLVDGRSLIDNTHGGIPKVVTALIQAMIATCAAEDNLIIATSGIKKPQLPFNVEHVHCYIPNKLISLGCQQHLWSFDEFFKNLSADLLFMPHFKFLGQSHLPYILLIHDLSFLIEPSWFDWRDRVANRLIEPLRLIQQAKHLFSVSGHTTDSLLRLTKVRPDDITTLQLGSTHRSVTSNNLLVFDWLTKPFFLFLGSDNRRKNLAAILPAFRVLRSQQPQVSLICIGKSSRITNITGVHWLDWVSDEQLTMLYRHATALLYPSWYEGYGLPLHEAAHAGTRIIASSFAALPETAPPGTIFVPPMKPHLWLKAMEAALAGHIQQAGIKVLPTWEATAALIWKKIKIR